MLSALLFSQAMITTLDTRPQPAVPATAFRCSFIRSELATGASSSFDLYGTIPELPEGHQPNDYVLVQMGSTTGSPLTGWGSANNLESSEWFRDYQISRSLDDEQWTINLKLRREGRSLAHLTVYSSQWQNQAESRFEPYRYDAVGLCSADFAPDTGAGQ